MGERNEIDDDTFKKLVEDERAVFAENCGSRERLNAEVPICFPVFSQFQTIPKWQREKGEGKGGKDQRDDKAGRHSRSRRRSRHSRSSRRRRSRSRSSPRRRGRSR